MVGPLAAPPSATPEVAPSLPFPDDVLLRCPDDDEIARLAELSRVRIGVIGCGGGGSNTVHRCVEEGVNGAELCALNTDVAHLLRVRAHRKILIGSGSTRGRGTGARPDLGLHAAEESEPEIRQFLEGAHIAFVTAGLGGGTGTGSAPVVARIAKETGALTMGIVTLPFASEGAVRREVALQGLERLRQVCDTTIVIENDRLLETAPEMTLEDAFRSADSLLTSAIKGITDAITKPGLVNLDFADLRTIMQHGGVALVGVGRSGSGKDRAQEAVASALASPLLGPVDLAQATGVMVHVIGDSSLTMGEAEGVAALIGRKVAPGARILWGCTIRDRPSGTDAPVEVLLVVTGVKAVAPVGPMEVTEVVPPLHDAPRGPTAPVMDPSERGLGGLGRSLLRRVRGVLAPLSERVLPHRKRPQ